jgi:hypothetical protein
VKLLAGRAISGFSAADTAKYASFLGCRTFERQDEFLGAASSEGGGGGGSSPPPVNPCDSARTPEEQQACDERQEQAAQPTVRGTGSVTRSTEDPRLFTYSVSFDQPVTGFELKRVGYVYCPSSTSAAWYDSCPAESRFPPGSGMRCEQLGGTSVLDFQCFSYPPQPDGEPSEKTIPAGQTVTGTYTTEAERPPPTATSVGLVGFQQNNGRGPETQIPVS